MKAVLFSSLYIGTQAQEQVIDTVLPGRLTKESLDLESGLRTGFKPSHKDISLEQAASLKGFRPALQHAEREPHIEIENPVIAIMTLPVHDQLEERLDWTPSSYVEASHVKFLESAGARVIPFDYDIEPKQLEKLMHQVNGIYLPGEHLSLMADSQYSKTVSAIISKAQLLNEEEGNHFPVVGFEYAAITMLQDAVKDKSFGHVLPAEQVNKRFHFEARKKPEETFLFDAVEEGDLMETFLRAVFYNELEWGISLEEIRNNKKVLKAYNPTVLFKESSPSQLIAAFEAHSFPFYGFMTSLDAHQFVFSKYDRVDHSAPARNFAQMVANHIVDEARMSRHVFQQTPEFMNEKDLTVVESELDFLEYYLF